MSKLATISPKDTEYVSLHMKVYKVVKWGLLYRKLFFTK